MEIPLKAKFRVGGWAKKVTKKTSGDGRLGEGKKHHKLTDKQKKALAPQPKMTRFINATGKARMVRL
jgi:hypothetical protein